MTTSRIASHVPSHHPDVSFGSGQKRMKTPKKNDSAESDKHAKKQPDNSVPVARRRRTPVRFPHTWHCSPAAYSRPFGSAHGT
eukprot:9787762-Karenia_brevis.AAC.1